MKRRFLTPALAALLLLPAGLMLAGYLWASWHSREAQRATQRRDLARAQEHWAQCLKVWRWSAAAYLEAARAARRAGEYDQAEAYLRSCRQLGGASEAIAVEQLLLRALNGELPKVEGFLVSRIRQDHPDTVHILEVLTPAYLQSYQLGNAKECVRWWLEREPDRIQAWLLRAQVFDRLNSRQEALESYQRVLELEPDNDEARLQMAGHLAHANRPHEAVDHFEYLRNTLGNVPPVLLGLARCRRALNQPEEARQLLQTLLAEHPGSWAAMADLGRLALDAGQTEEAANWFRRAAQLRPYEKDVQYGLYQCLERLGQRAEAQQVLAHLKRIEADHSRLADLAREIAFAPRGAALRCEAAEILLRNGQEDEALRWLESALVEDPYHAPTHQSLATYFERTGDQERAARHHRLAAQMRDVAVQRQVRQAAP